VNRGTFFGQTSFWNPRRHQTAVCAMALVACVWTAPGAWSQVRLDGPPKARVRAKPPTAWDKATSSTFFADAFDTLDGERPDFSAVAATASGAATAPQSGAAPAGMAGGGGTGGFKWSALVSPETLADEIKEMKGTVSKAVASASDFKGGGYNDARKAFSAIALSFALIADYDGDVRWKKDAETARDLFARVGNNCKVGTQQSFDESKARVADLDALLEGNPIDAKSDREDDWTWSQVAGRPPLMSRLETADGIANAAVASKDDFNKQVEKLLHEVEIVAAIGEAIQRPDYEYHDDDTYRGYASQMRDAAVKARAAVQKSDYDATRTAVGEIKKSCDACHGDYRS
jgi:cytochrome c556